MKRSWPLASVLAHRCGGSLAPENSLAGLEAAVAAGCGGVEFDVMLSGSGSPVLIHDETLQRTSDGCGYVADTPDERLRELDVGRWFGERFAGERIPTLAQAAARCIALGLSVNLEIKPSEGTERVTAGIVARDALALWSDAPLPPLLSSFSVRALEVAARVAPALPRGLLVDRVPDDWLDRCAALDVTSLHVNAARLARHVVTRAHDAGLAVAVYTVNDPQRARTFFDWGVSGVITDRPDIVRPPEP